MTPILGYWIAIKKFKFSITKKINEKNETFAAFCTRMFGSMAMFYILFIWALLPLVPALAHYQNFIAYVSADIIQLVALPLLMVGGIVLNRASEKRAEEDHLTLMKEFEEIKLLHKEATETSAEIKDAHAETHKLLAMVLKSINNNENNS